MRMRSQCITAGIACLIAVLPLGLNPYWIDVLNNVAIYSILSLSLNLIVGHTGLFNLGHAAFYAIGAYTTGILNTHYQVPILWTLPVSAVTAGLFAMLVARPIIHLRGDYLCIVTIGVGEILRIALVNDVFGITGGSNGISGIARPSLFGYVIRTPMQFYYLLWTCTGITVFLLHFLEYSRFGRAINYLREDEVAAEGSGINTAHYKLAVFVLGAGWAGMVGTLYASKMMLIAPEAFSFWESVLMFAIVILGGSGSIPGMLLGAFLVVGLPELFREFANARMLVFGAAMVVMMIFRTQGLLPARPRRYDLPIEGEAEVRS